MGFTRQPNVPMRVQIVGEMEDYPYGKFGWIIDPDGNKIELWEPKDEGF